MGKKKCCCACCITWPQRPAQVILFPNAVFGSAITLSGTWSNVEYFGIPQECCIKFTSAPVAISGLTSFNLCNDVANQSWEYTCKYRQYYWDYFDFPIVTDCSQSTPVTGRLLYERTLKKEFQRVTKFQYQLSSMWFEIFLSRREVLVDYVPTCLWFVTVNLMSNDGSRKIRIAHNTYSIDTNIGVIDSVWQGCNGAGGRFLGTTTGTLGNPTNNPCNDPIFGGPNPRIIRSWRGAGKPIQILFPEGASIPEEQVPCQQFADDIEEYIYDTSTYCDIATSCTSIGGISNPTVSSPPAVPTISAGRFTSGHYCFNGLYFNVDTYAPSSCMIGTNGGFARPRYMCDFDLFSGCRSLHWLDSRISHYCNIINAGPHFITRPTFGLEFVW